MSITGVVAAATLALSAVASCGAPTPPAVNTSRYVFADSLGAQVVAAGLTEGDGHIWRAEAGATLERWADQVTAAAAKNPRSISLALGSNDAATWKADWGWTVHDQAVWSWIIMSVNPDTCLSVVLPHFEASAEIQYPGILAEIEQARAWLSTVPHVDHVADWRPVVESHPGWLVDGIHVGSVEAAQARHDISIEGCG